MSDKEPPYLGSWKGRVIKAIALDGARTWEEIRSSTGLYPKSLNVVLSELFNAQALTKTKDNEYRVEKQLYKQYKSYFENQKDDEKIVPKVNISEEIQKELIHWIGNWKDVKKLDIDLKNKHFFLEGRFLNDFSQDIIANAKKEVLIVNPWIKDCDLSNTMRDAVKKSAAVTIIRRPIDDENDKDFIELLKKEGIKAYINKKVHAKLIAVDRAVAIVSSMNFIVQSSGGQSWEAGIVSVDSTVVESVVNSILKLIERPDSVED